MRHGGMAEILATRKAPGVCTRDNFALRHFQAAGLKPPRPEGWNSRTELKAALKANGMEGVPDSKPMRDLSDAMAKAPPVGTVVKREDMEAL